MAGFTLRLLVEPAMHASHGHTAWPDFTRPPPHPKVKPLHPSNTLLWDLSWLQEIDYRSSPNPNNKHYMGRRSG